MARLLLAAFVALTLVSAITGPALAQGKARKAAEEALRLGIASQKARQHNQAVVQFSNAIASGALARKQLTYALYLRAVSHRAVKRPALAIADLNNALFFKGDLSQDVQAAALKERARAYKDAGLKPTPLVAAVPQNVTPVASAAETSKTKIKPRVSRSTLPPTAPILGPDTRQPLRRAPAQVTTGTRVSVPARVSAPNAPRQAPANWKVATQAKPAQQPQVSAWSQPKVTEANAAPSPASQRATSSNGVASFFSNLFNPSQASKPVTTGTVAQGQPALTAAQSSGAASTWQTTARQANTRTRTAPGQRTAALPSSAGTAFEIAVSAVRSKKNAQALARRLNKKYAGSPSWIGKKARVDQIPARGNRGPLYSVRLGIYTDRGALASQCEKLIADGLECQIIRRN